MSPEDFFQTLVLESNGEWFLAHIDDETGISYGSGMYLRPDYKIGGPCVAKQGKYHIFTKRSNPPVYWIVNTEVKEVRRTNGEYKLKDLDDLVLGG